MVKLNQRERVISMTVSCVAEPTRLCPRAVVGLQGHGRACSESQTSSLWLKSIFTAAAKHPAESFLIKLCEIMDLLIGSPVLFERLF